MIMYDLCCCTVLPYYPFCLKNNNDNKKAQNNKQKKISEHEQIGNNVFLQYCNEEGMN